MKLWQSVSLPAWLKGLNIEVIRISGFTNSEIRITSALRYFCQFGRLADWLPARISFYKTLCPVPWTDKLIY